MFFDAESGEGAGGTAEGEAAGGAGASDTSSEAGSLTSEEGSVSSENSELGGSEYNHPTKTCKSSPIKHITSLMSVLRAFVEGSLCHS